MPRNGAIIKKIIEFENVYHCLIQAYNGTIYHYKFNDKAEALDFVTRFGQVKVKIEKVD